MKIALNDNWKSKAGDLEDVKACDLCGASCFEPELKANGWSLVKCNTCGLVFTTPRYSEKLIRKMYESGYYKIGSRYLSDQLKKPSRDLYNLAGYTKKMVRPKNMEKNPRSLDIGCGGGYVVSAFRSCGWQALGVDLSAEAVNAGRNMGVDLRTGSIEDCELGYFDIITAFHVLEHTNSPKVFLNQCYCLLDERGFLLVEVPDYGSKRSLRMAQNWPYLFPDLHLYQFTVDSLTRYLAKFNFELCSVRRIGGGGP